MKNRATFGNSHEVKTASILSDEGWLVSSRRHIGGAGDLLAIKPNYRPRLIEVKASNAKSASPFGNFRRDDRDFMRICAEEYGCIPELAWWPRGSEAPKWIPLSAWPS